MHKPKILIYFLIAIFLINFAEAATIHGAIYDLSLKKINNARVEVNTSPKQFMIAQNGSYSFNVPNGAYVIKAQLMQKNNLLASVQENITIKQDGSYVLDLILFPDIDEGVEDINIDVNETIIETNNNKLVTVYVTLLIAIIVLIALFYFIKYKQKKEAIKEREEIKIKNKEEYEEGDLQQIIDIIKQEGGRTTQKDIRRQIPLSEAKISLMIAELEHKGVIEKIKKGRGNIIILKKK